MKLLFSILVGTIMLFIGCRPGYEITKTTLVYGYDFTKYSKQGFLFTPESYSGNYESIGLIELYLYPSVTKEKEKVDKNPDSWQRVSFDWYVGTISPNELIDSLYSITKGMGADAVIRFAITETDPKTNGEVTFTGLKASGFAIKRK